MPANNFEKQVQQRMDELELSPSNEVWEEVEKRIHKEKKRRRFILWLFLLPLLLAGGATWWWLQPANEKVATVTNTTVNSNKNDNIGTTATNNDNVLSDKKNVLSDKKETSAVAGNDIKSNNSGTPNNKPNKSVAKKKHAKPNKITRNQDLSIETKQPTLARVTKTSGKPNKPVETASKPIDQPTDVVDITTLPADKNVNMVIAKEDAKEPVAIGIPVKKDSVIEKTETTTTKSPIQLKPKKKKWEFGVNLFVGTSNTIKGVLENLRKYDAYASTTIPPNPGASFYPAALDSRPVSPTNGFAWHIGGYAKRNLSNKLAFSIGANLAVYSNNQPIGPKINSERNILNNGTEISIPYFYLYGKVNTYHNRFVYAQFPLSLHWQVNKGKKMPLIWDNGIVFGRLLGSNAVVYNSAANLYYQNKDWLRPNQWTYQTGFSAKWFQDSKHPLTTGISFSTQITTLEKNFIGENKHLSSFGIRLGWIIKK